MGEQAEDDARLGFRALAMAGAIPPAVEPAQEGDAMEIDEVLALVNLKSEQAPKSVDEVRERYNQRAEDEWHNLPSEVRAGVANALADLWDGSMDDHDQDEQQERRRIRDHFRAYAQDPD